LSWRRGQTIVLQEVWRGKVWAARPMIVAEDSQKRLALWFPRGTTWKAPTGDPTRPWHDDRGERLADCAALGHWVFRDAAWDVDTLCLLEPGAGYAIWVSWLPDFEPWGWYVNLQKPFVRAPKGIQTMDLMLDVIVDLDGSWRWKDEDELETFVRHGVFSRALANRARRDGLEAIRRVAQDDPPFSEPWHDWRPDAAWSLPRLPTGWDCL
jgi:Protein of unknown function (DUF402)